MKIMKVKNLNNKGIGQFTTIIEEIHAIKIQIIYSHLYNGIEEAREANIAVRTVFINTITVACK